MQLMHTLLTQSVRVKLRHGRSLTGRLVAYDDHLNLMLSDAIETVIDAYGNTDKNQL
jgi:small nuclear ribonucleoprotein (snRNP)-like protein